MKVLAIAMQKGGVGKSTLTRSLAVAAVLEGFNTLILDMDAQQSTGQWGKRRGEATMPPVRFVTEMDLPDTLARARQAGCELVVIDTPPARSTEAPAAVEAADLVLIPCTPDIEAYEQLPRTARLARATGTPAAAVLTMAAPTSRAEVDISAEVFKEIGVPMVPAILHRLKVHRDASREGKTPQEVEPDGKAAAELAALWAWTCAELQLRTRARVHKRKVA